MAIERGHAGMVRFLFDSKAAVDDAVDGFGRTPLSLADWLGDEAIALLLLDSKATVD